MQKARSSLITCSFFYKKNILLLELRFFLNLTKFMGINHEPIEDN